VGPEMRPGAQAGEAAMPTNRVQVKASSAAAATGALSSRRKETKKAPKTMCTQAIERERSAGNCGYFLLLRSSFRSKKGKFFIGKKKHKVCACARIAHYCVH